MRPSRGFPRGIRPWLELVGDLLRRLVTDAQLVFIDKSVVNPIDVQVAQGAVVVAVFEKIRGDIVAEPQALEEILIDDVGPGRNDRVHHVVTHHIGEYFL
jgi:hypothetical protein